MLLTFSSDCRVNSPSTRAIAAKLNSGIAIVELHLRFSAIKIARFYPAEADSSVSRDWLASLQFAFSGEHTDSWSRKVVSTVIGRNHVHPGQARRNVALYASILLRIIEGESLEDVGEIFLFRKQ